MTRRQSDVTSWAPHGTIGAYLTDMWGIGDGMFGRHRRAPCAPGLWARSAPGLGGLDRPRGSGGGSVPVTIPPPDTIDTPPVELRGARPLWVAQLFQEQRSLFL